jgi:hypothetical protein
MKSKIEFKDLDNWLKIAVIYGWISVFIWVIYFLYGIVEGIIAVA